MSTDHLHAAPEPGRDEEPGPGEQVTAPPLDQADEERTARGIASMPDLRPYCDVRQLADLAPHARLAGRLLAGGVRRLLRTLGRGLRALSALAVAWLSGKIGKRGGALARLGVAAGVVYGAARLSFSHPVGPWIASAGLLLVVLLAGLDRLPGGSPKPAKRKSRAAPSGQRRGLVARFATRRRATSEVPATDLPLRPSEPPLTALIRELIGADTGVHLAVLRPAMRDRLPGLSGASDKELNEALIEAGYDPSRKVRAGGVAGRAGVHRSQLPPLSPANAPGPLSAPGDRSGPADSPHPESGGERPESGRRYVRAPELGPDAWRIEHDGR